MLNSKRFFNKKTLTVLIAGVIILAILTVLTSTGVMHNKVTCHDCDEAVVAHACYTCDGEGVDDCEDCKYLTDKSSCENCGGTGKVTCAECEGAKTLNYGYQVVNTDENGKTKCTACGGEEGSVSNCSKCNGTGEMVEGVDYLSATTVSGKEVKIKLDEDAKEMLCESCGGATEVTGSLWALIPPIIAIGLALITKEVFSSLFIGILSGGILANDFAPLGTLDTVLNTGLISAVSGNAGIFIFLIELGILVALVNKAGGSRAFGKWAEKNVKSKVGAAICTFILGVLIFIDDYFNCLTVGSVMRPVTDKHKISRSKLAYLIDATAAPICMIAPISSWAAAVSQYAADGQGLNLFITAIPFNFYSLMTFVFIISLVLMKFDFGPMRKHELNAQNGDLFSGRQIVSNNETPNEKGRVFDLICPIIFLIISCVFALVYIGGILDGASFIDAFAETDATVGLPWGGLIALVVTIIYFAIRGVVSVKDSMDAFPKGFIAMVPAIFILTFATALKNMTIELGAAVYVGDAMRGFKLASLLPAVIFVVACLLAFATGTSWGTFGILIPIVTAMFPDGGTLMVIGMSACLAGAVCGDHCSPISDTTIMSSAGAECEHLNHVTTQIPYAVFVAVISFVLYLVAGFVQTAYVMLPLGALLTVGALFVTRAIVRKKEAQEKAEEFAKTNQTENV